MSVSIWCSNSQNAFRSILRIIPLSVDVFINVIKNMDRAAGNPRDTRRRDRRALPGVPRACPMDNSRHAQ